MTRAEIVAELRRSAVEDMHPWVMCKGPAYLVAESEVDIGGGWASYGNDDVAVFFLLVACALEDEA